MFITKEKDNVRKVLTLSKWIKESDNTIVFTGAGMSTESGIPDFRSKDGLWRGIDPMKVACIDAIRKNYDLFHQFYKERVENLEKCIPHIGYDILAKWEGQGLINRIITQNVDGFHERAGNTNVYCLHGSINSFRCSQCDQPASKEDFINKEPCSKCGGLLRPGVVLFGEALDQDILNKAINEIKKADLVIVIGTSLMVYPVNMLPSMSKGRKVYINKEISHEEFDLDIPAMAGQILLELEQIINSN